MTYYMARVLSALIVAAIFCIPQNTYAQPADTIICPINCDRSRDLYLSDPPMTGEDVNGLQKTLNSLGFYKSLSGVFDRETERAVCQFQKKFSLEVDGKVVDSTWMAMADAVETAGPMEKTPPPTGSRTILIDTGRRTLTLFNDGEPYRQFPVAVGKPETPTPIGAWKVARKAANWGTGFGSRWLGLNVYWGIYGIHGTNKPYSIGGYQSHGCIRMHNRHVEQLYSWVSVGTPVIIVGNVFGYMDPPYKIMRQGDKSSAVMEVQSALKRLGYNIEVDGIWGSGMEKAIIQYRKDAGLPFDNSVNRVVYQSLGLK